jgi:hypothetical protein
MTATVLSASAPEALALENDLQAFYAAWTKRDDAAIRALFSDRADLKVWGSDVFERVLGRDEVDRDFPSWIASCPPWVAIAPTHRVVRVYDGVAWAADDVEGRWSSGNQSGLERYRVTTIWERIGGDWRIVHANVAIPH